MIFLRKTFCDFMKKCLKTFCDFHILCKISIVKIESMSMFRRKIYDKLVGWKKESQGKTSLLIEGARRIGKSTIVEEFAKKEYKSYILIDFAFANQNVKDLFKDLSDLNYFFLQLQLQFNVDLEIRNSIIIFDEIQFYPLARQAIKVLVKDGRYDYIETGSLISIKKNVKDILIPSEERKLNMYPMDFEEFLWALGDTTTIPFLKKFYDNRIPLGDDTNRKMIRKFRLYMLVGGMPQAVNEYIETNNLRKVDVIKRDILNLYDDDFKRIDPSGKLSVLFNSIPSELSKNASRYQVSSNIGSFSASAILECIAQMADSKVVLISYQANDPSIGLSSNKNLSLFKMFVCDTGLFTTLMFKDKDFTENIVYEKLLNDKLPVNLGYLYENVVAQMLASNGNGLFYHTWPNAASRHNYEIDFLLSSGSKICPIEVKSSGYKAHTSLDEFSKKYSDRILKKYLIYTKDLKIDGDLTYLPVYMTLFL